MAIIAAILFVALADMADGTDTHFTVYSTSDCSGGAVGEITETTNKDRELRWGDASDTVFTACNDVTCRVGGSTSCGMSDWGIKMLCNNTNAIQIEEYKGSSVCTSSTLIGYIQLNETSYAAAYSGGCGAGTYTSTWGSGGCGDAWSASCVSMVYVKFTGLSKPLAGAICSSMAAPAPAAPSPAGSPTATGNATNSTNTTAAPQAAATTSKANLPLNFLVMPLAMVMGSVIRMV